MAYQRKLLQAKRETLPSGFSWFPQQMIDARKVAALRSHILAGGTVPPVVVARYGDSVMPIDGHHRCSAHSAEGLPLEAWVVSGARYEALERNLEYHPKHLVECDGVPAMEVASRFADADTSDR